jgi:hypothetical protein
MIYPISLLLLPLLLSYARSNLLPLLSSEADLQLFSPPLGD